MKNPNLAVWWLSKQDYKSLTNIRKLPKYIRDMLEQRKGRAGRCRLWTSPETEIEGLGIELGDPRFKIVESRGDSGGLVIHAKDAPACAARGGLLTTLDLQKIAADGVMGNEYPLGKRPVVTGDAGSNPARPRTEQQKVDDWNGKYRVGTPVLVNGMPNVYTITVAQATLAGKMALAVVPVSGMDVWPFLENVTPYVVNKEPAVCSPPRCTCDDFKAACGALTDSEAKGSLIYGHYSNWIIGSNLNPIKFCPWCGKEVPEV